MDKTQKQPLDGLQCTADTNDAFSTKASKDVEVEL